MTEKRSVRVLFVRHGLTIWNKDARYQGHTDIPLSEEGLSQAEAVGKRLSGERIDRIYCSDLTRARQTAEAISRYTRVPLKVDPRLREMHFGQWEGLTYSEIGARWPDQQRAWMEDPTRLSIPGGESMAQLECRLKLALNDIYLDLASATTESGRTPCGIVVSHGGVIGSYISYALTGSITGDRSRRVRQTSVTTCDLTGETLVMLDCDNVGHLSN